MSATNSKLPRRLAGAGAAITPVLAGISWLIIATDLLGLLPVQLSHWPHLLPVVTGMTFILCPPELPLAFASINRPGSGQLAAWAIAAALNGLLYYFVGRGIVALREKWRRNPAGKGTRNP